MIGDELAVEQLVAAEAQPRDEVGKGDLGGVGHPAEHAFAEIGAAQRHAVEAADQIAANVSAAPHLDRMGVAVAVEDRVGLLDLPVDPGFRAIGGGLGVPDFTVIDYIFDGVDQIRIGEGACVINLPEAWFDDVDGYPGTFRITYNHGYAQVPGDVVAVACGMVLRALTAPTTMGGVTGETIGSYSYRLASADTGLSVTLGQTERTALARYRRTEGMIKVGR